MIDGNHGTDDGPRESGNVLPCELCVLWVCVCGCKYVCSTALLAPQSPFLLLAVRRLILWLHLKYESRAVGSPLISAVKLLVFFSSTNNTNRFHLDTTSDGPPSLQYPITTYLQFARPDLDSTFKQKASRLVSHDKGQRQPAPRAVTVANKKEHGGRGLEGGRWANRRQGAPVK